MTMATSLLLLLLPMLQHKQCGMWHVALPPPQQQQQQQAR